MKLSRNSYKPALVLLLLISSCSRIPNTVEAEAAIIEFHTRLNSEEFIAIYESSAKATRTNTKRTDVENLLKSIRTNLGKVINSRKEKTILSHSMDSPSKTTLIYKTEFEHGSGYEKFEVINEDGRPAIFFYFLESADLMRKLTSQEQPKR
ncbi:hypothetical protein [Pseudomonas schmalbachii]|uniref:DUF3887 domain-containing protein n=1 Tax=Pseudomonas schmalbachii TaxID=2816993 RepID=A0ABS3TRP0_9PSED|nr:hypothetical protein [Pseudomonas schmalbachii]MBO3276336.1 hypothetical protein [Pseudomonas schmalbachii]